MLTEEGQVGVEIDKSQQNTIDSCLGQTDELLRDLIWRSDELNVDLLQKFRWGKARPTAGRNYAASAVNCCLSESGAVDPKLPCSFRIM